MMFVLFRIFKEIQTDRNNTFNNEDAEEPDEFVDRICDNMQVSAA